MKTTYAPKFPETSEIPWYYKDHGHGPLHRYDLLIGARNKKVANGEKLDYHIEKERRIIKPKKDLMCYVSRVSVPELDSIRETLK